MRISGTLKTGGSCRGHFRLDPGGVGGQGPIRPPFFVAKQGWPRKFIHKPPMPRQETPEIDLLRAAYQAFNARDIDAALALMTENVAWPRAFKGGFVRGAEEIRAYWTEQWSEINPHVEPVAFHAEEGGRILVKVHQIVRDLRGATIADDIVGHRFTLEEGLILMMEVNPLPTEETREA
jgi:hypothetical protein